MTKLDWLKPLPPRLSTRTGICSHIEYIYLIVSTATHHRYWMYIVMLVLCRSETNWKCGCEIWEECSNFFHFSEFPKSKMHKPYVCNRSVEATVFGVGQWKWNWCLIRWLGCCCCCWQTGELMMRTTQSMGLFGWKEGMLIQKTKSQCLWCS